MVRYSRRCSQLPPTLNSRLRGRSLLNTTRAFTLFFAWRSSTRLRRSLPPRDRCLEPGEIFLGRFRIASEPGIEHAEALVLVVPRLALSASPDSVSSQYMRLPESSPTIVASSFAAYPLHLRSPALDSCSTYCCVVVGR